MKKSELIKLIKNISDDIAKKNYDELETEIDKIKSNKELLPHEVSDRINQLRLVQLNNNMHEIIAGTLIKIGLVYE